MNNQLHKCRVWGLYSCIRPIHPHTHPKPIHHDPIAIPLKSLDIKVQILHNTARVFYTQVYQNESDKYLETEFFFPISPDACFDSFEAKFQDHVIKGVIKKKEEAKEEYKEAISQGRTAAYSEINEETSDTMKVMIGNIPPKTDISIQYSYIQKLETSLNKFWCYRLFSTITPRYNSNLNQLADQDIKLLANYPLISSKKKGAYPWTINVEIQSPSPISLLKSPTHKIVTNYGNEKHTCTVNLAPGTTHHPNKDFVLLYSNGKEDEKIDCVVTPFEEGYCAMVSMLADFDQTSAADTYKHFVKKESVKNEHAMTAVRGEYIFLIDRSGSMGGDRIEMAKTSLNLFLKSLPTDSYCNVVSFGSSHQFLRNTSVALSSESLESLTSEITNFAANMGGTEIYSALKRAFQLPLKKGYPRFVFLLTDGAVSNTHQVLDLIKMNSEKSRVFTIGVGNGCSPELITKGALYGMGKHQFVTENKTIFEKVIDLLNASLSPCYSEFSLEGENFDAMVKSVSPNPTSIPFLINGQTVTFFFLLRDGIFDNDSQNMEFKLKMYDTRIGGYRAVPFSLNKENVLQNDFIPKLAVHDMIKRLEEDAEKKDDLLWLDKREIKKTLLELSLNYGVLCKQTAFFCDMKENGKFIKSFEQTKIVIPTLTPVESDLASSSGRGGYFATCKSKASFVGNSCSTKSKKSAVMRSSNISYDNFNSRPSTSLMTSGTMDSIPVHQVKKYEEARLGNTNLEKNVKCKSNAVLRPKTSNTLSSQSSLKENLAAPQRRAEAKSTNIQSDSYLDIIMKQNFEGSWSSKDQQILKTVLKDGQLSEVPQGIQAKAQANLELVWMTILVLVWLETIWKSEEGAWSLIHKKGVEWLKIQGVAYNDVKEIGKTVIKTN